MRVAFVLNNLSGGGAERVAVNVANTMAGLGHDVSLVLNHRRGPYLSDVSANVRILSLGKRMLSALPSLARLLRRERFDAVLTVLDQPSIGCLLLKPFIGRTRVIVVECNNPLASGGAVTGMAWKTIRRLRPYLYPHADHIITKSEGIRAALVKHFNGKPVKITAIPNPVDTSRIDALAGEAVEHRWFAADRQIPVVVAMGRLSVQKGFDRLLESFALVIETTPARLVILGEGHERAALEELVRRKGLEKCVDLPGFVKNPYSYVAKADCFVLSSRWEGWPNALVEALACGTVAVSTDCESGPREILKGGEYGVLVPQNDREGLASGLLEALQSNRDAARLRRRVLEFSPETIAEKYIAAVEESMRRYD
ncbi:glycosyltransferase [Martelella endophytica]|uniref:Glycosyl transferase family 1 n=1 Tax=Martelella endophytica TaxID=1486262 RepID=A0A0D5LUD9_MAREN|nr:glycosyltransferase [Martelella endophytica]AJY46968.1 hypothetical protein TM49_16815 [Martelella endophytica]